VKSRLRPSCGKNSQCQEFIIRFYNYLEIEMIKKFPLTAKEYIISELMKATHVSRTKIFGIVSGGISGIKSSKKQKRPKKYSCDSFDKQIIKSVINQFYAEKTLPYIKDIHKIIPENKNLNFKDWSLTAFYSVMKEMGFKKGIFGKYLEEY
jgi:hypothetical protein